MAAEYKSPSTPPPKSRIPDPTKIVGPNQEVITDSKEVNRIINLWRKLLPEAEFERPLVNGDLIELDSLWDDDVMGYYKLTWNPPAIV